MQNFKKYMSTKLLLVQNWGKWPIWLNQQQRPLMEIPYKLLLFVMTLHYHRLYQILSLGANLSLEDMKQLCEQKPP